MILTLFGKKIIKKIIKIDCTWKISRFATSGNSTIVSIGSPIQFVISGIHHILTRSNTNSSVSDRFFSGLYPLTYFGSLFLKGP